jgi:stage II sporulation protein E
MGSGREAAAVAQICTSFVGSMLKLGNMSKELLEMLNGFLCGRREGSAYECSATFDLMELDLINGKAVFFKSGAAPTYLFRSGSLFKLRSRTMPIGILANADTKRFEFELSEGDTVIMMSDGITGGHEECPWLFDLLRQNIDSSGLERTADLILKYAVGHGSEDDISLAIIRVNGVP